MNMTDNIKWMSRSELRILTSGKVLLLFGGVGAVSLAAVCAVLFSPIVAKNDNAAPVNATWEDRKMIRDALSFYADGRNHGNVSAFDSKHPPKWWKAVSGDWPFQPGMDYYVPSRYVGMPICKVRYRADFIICRPK